VVGLGASALLLERVLAGDEAAIEPLVVAAWPRLGRRSWQSLAYEEVRVEALEELVEAAHAYRAEPTGDFAEFAVARMQRRLSRLIRAERRRRTRLFPLLPSDDGRAATGMRTRFDDEVESPALANALRRLSPRQRALIARMYWQGLTAGDIAAQDGTGAEAVRRRRRRAEAALRRALTSSPKGRGWPKAM
jgi:RNA polymerase sigma factor (sigma-70 family)